MKDILEALVTIHGLWRWLVLLAALGAIGAGAAVWAGQFQWRPAERIGLIFTIVLDIEVALGLLVWLLSLVQGKNLGLALLVIHPLVMLVAVGIAHMVRVRADRVATDAGRARLTTLGFLAALILIILVIPGLLIPAA
jgi:hypothetical protein